jgi:hypothetical protein
MWLQQLAMLLRRGSGCSDSGMLLMKEVVTSRC